MSKININHIAIAVEDLERSLAFWRDALGLQDGGIEHVEAEEVQIAFLETENAHIELVQPTTEDSGIARYMAKKGQGIHHICVDVENIEATMNQLKERGVELINEMPRERNGKRYAFVHPRSTGGVLLELYETSNE